MTIGEKLQTMRTGQGLSQDAPAEALEVSCHAVSRWKREEMLPEPKEAVRLLITMDDLRGHLLASLQNPKSPFYKYLFPNCSG